MEIYPQFIGEKEFKDLFNFISKLQPKFEKAEEIVALIESYGKFPMVILSELYPNIKDLGLDYYSVHNIHYQYKIFKEAMIEEILENSADLKDLSDLNDLSEVDENFFPIAFPAFLYDLGVENRKLKELIFKVELLSLKTIEKLLEITKIPYGLVIASQNIPRFWIWRKRRKLVPPYPVIKVKRKNSTIHVIVLAKRKFIEEPLIPEIVEVLSQTVQTPKIIMPFFGAEVDLFELFDRSSKKQSHRFRVISSPLDKKIAPKNANPDPFTKVKKVGMNELKATFVLTEDLLGGEDASQEEKKMIWSSIEGKEKFDAPYLQKGDIVIPIKRQDSFSVAIVCEDPAEKEIFVPKQALAIIRLNPEIYSFKDMERLAKLLSAEFKLFSSYEYLNVSKLRILLNDLLKDNDLESALKEEEEDKFLKVGRTVVRRKLNKHLNPRRKEFQFPLMFVNLEILDEDPEITERLYLEDLRFLYGNTINFLYPDKEGGSDANLRS